MKRMLLLFMLVLFVASTAEASTCMWEPSPARDTSHYNLYLCLDGADPCLNGVFDDRFNHGDCNTTGSIQICKWDGCVMDGVEGTGCVTAVDTSGNEGGCSNTDPFDFQAPPPPQNFRIEG